MTATTPTAWGVGSSGARRASKTTRRSTSTISPAPVPENINIQEPGRRHLHGGGARLLRLDPRLLRSQLGHRKHLPVGRACLDGGESHLRRQPVRELRADRYSARASRHFDRTAGAHQSSQTGSPQPHLDQLATDQAAQARVVVPGVQRPGVVGEWDAPTPKTVARQHGLEHLEARVDSGRARSPPRCGARWWRSARPAPRMLLRPCQGLRAQGSDVGRVVRTAGRPALLLGGPRRGARPPATSHKHDPPDLSEFNRVDGGRNTYARVSAEHHRHIRLFIGQWGHFRQPSSQAVKEKRSWSLICGVLGVAGLVAIVRVAGLRGMPPRP